MSLPRAQCVAFELFSEGKAKGTSVCILVAAGYRIRARLFSPNGVGSNAARTDWQKRRDETKRRLVSLFLKILDREGAHSQPLDIVSRVDEDDNNNCSLWLDAPMSPLPLGSCELTELPRVLLVGVDCLSFQVYESCT